MSCSDHAPLQTASQLSKAAVSRMREERNTLPCDTHTAIDSLLSVVSRPKTKVGWGGERRWV